MMNLRTTVVGALVALCSTFGVASAASITIGSFTFDDTAFADTSSLAAGNPAGTIVNGVISGNISGAGVDATNLQGASGDVLEVGFTDNQLGNGDGFDLLVFEISVPQAPTLGLSVAGPTISGVLEERVTFNGATVNIFSYDLADLGLNDGEVLTGNLFFSSMNTFNTNLGAVAAINEGGRPAPDVVPLPAGVVLLLSGVGALALARHRA